MALFPIYGRTVAGRSVRRHSLIFVVDETQNVQLLRMLLDWRGPDGQYLDFLSHGPRKLSTTFMNPRPAFLRCILAWRGPGGEFMDITKHEACRYVLQWSVSAAQMLLDWEGPEGQRWHPSADADNFYFDDVNMAVLRLLLDWRAPGGQWVHLDALVEQAFMTQPPKPLKPLQVLLDRRGPDGEWCDLRGAVAAHLDIVVKDATLYHFVQSWRGPGGEWVDVRSMVQTKHLDWYLLKILLVWRGPGGEWVDGREVWKMYGNRMVRGSFLPTIKGLLNWRGPGGECLHAREVLTSVVEELCERRRGWTDFEQLLDLLLAWRGPAGEWLDGLEVWNSLHKCGICPPQSCLCKLLKWQKPDVGGFVLGVCDTTTESDRSTKRCRTS
jgi:hypothetical protein